MDRVGSPLGKQHPAIDLDSPQVADRALKGVWIDEFKGRVSLCQSTVVAPTYTLF